MTTMVKQGQSSNAIAYLDYICKYIYACIPNTSVAFLVYNVVYFNSIRVESSYICFLNIYRSVRILLGSSSKFTVEKRAGLSAQGGMNYWFKLPPRHIIFFKF